MRLKGFQESIDLKKNFQLAISPKGCRGRRGKTVIVILNWHDVFVEGGHAMYAPGSGHNSHSVRFAPRKIYFISVFILLIRRKATEALIHRVGNYPDLLPEMARYRCPLVI